jgi:hypothetical protein
MARELHFLVKLCKKPHFVCISNWQGLNVQQPHVGDFKLALKAQALVCISYVQNVYNKHQQSLFVEFYIMIQQDFWGYCAF